jgi:hypothetical protein
MAGKLAVAAWYLQWDRHEHEGGAAEGFHATGLAMSREKKLPQTKERERDWDQFFYFLEIKYVLGTIFSPIPFYKLKNMMFLKTI